MGMQFAEQSQNVLTGEDEAIDPGGLQSSRLFASAAGNINHCGPFGLQGPCSGLAHFGIPRIAC